jgi:hypothetical protein
MKHTCNNNARFRVFEPFVAYIEYLKRNNIKFHGKNPRQDKYGVRYDYIEFDAKDRFEAKEDYVGLCGVSGYIYETQDGQETILLSL